MKYQRKRLIAFFPKIIIKSTNNYQHTNNYWYVNIYRKNFAIHDINSQSLKHKICVFTNTKNCYLCLPYLLTNQIYSKKSTDIYDECPETPSSSSTTTTGLTVTTNPINSPYSIRHNLNTSGNLSYRASGNNNNSSQGITNSSNNNSSASGNVSNLNYGFKNEGSSQHLSSKQQVGAVSGMVDVFCVNLFFH